MSIVGVYKPLAGGKATGQTSGLFKVRAQYLQLLLITIIPPVLMGMERSRVADLYRVTGLQISLLVFVVNHVSLQSSE